LKSNIQYNDNAPLEPIISNSIFDYYNEIMMEIKKILEDEYTFQETLKNYNPHEYLFSTIPSLNQCVSELHKSNVFYDLHEIIKTIEIPERGTIFICYYELGFLYLPKNGKIRVEQYFTSILQNLFDGVKEESPKILL
jgi:hypothetical protein